MCITTKTISILFCKPAYFVADIPVTFRVPQQRLDVNWTSLSPVHSQIDGLDPFELLGNIVNASSVVRMPANYQPPKTSANNEPFLRLAALTLSELDPATTYLDALLAPETMEVAVQQAFTGIAAIVVNKRLLRPVTNTISGAISYYQSRVQVEVGTAVASGALLIACSVMASLLFLIRPQRVVPTDPGSIGGIALLVHRSRQLRSLFSSNLSETTTRMKCATFATGFEKGPNPRFVVIPKSQDQGQNTENSGKPPHQVSSLWQPTTLATWSRMTAIALPILVISALEILQRRSDALNGIVTIDTTDKIHYATTLVPALVMWGIAALHTSIHFNITLLSPYHALSKCGVNARRSILSSNLGKLPPLALFASISQRHIAAAFAAVATIAGSFTTIVVSGIYSLEPNSVDSTLLARRPDKFDVSWNGTFLDDGGAAVLLNFINWQNLSYPDWTYNDLAIPKISVDGNMSQIRKNATTLSAILPARRAVLDCESNGPANVTVGLGQNSADIYTTVNRSCPGSTGDAFSIRINSLRKMNGFGGEMSQFVENSKSASAWSHGVNVPPNPNNEAGCASLIFFFGSFPSVVPPDRERSVNLTSEEAQVTTLVCKQLVQELDTKVSFLLPDLKIDALQPPIPDESTARYVNDGSSTGSNVQEFMTSFPLSNFLEVLSDDPSVIAASLSLSGMHPFYKSIVLAAGIEPSDLVGQENINRLISATNTMYSRYMAQVMSRTMRLEEPVSDQEVTISYNEMRLVQNRGPKIGLQALLGVMAAFSATSLVFMRSSKLLPHDPASIAGVAALLYGSDLWRSDGTNTIIPDGSQWLGPREISQKKLWRHKSFSMGRRPDGTFGINVMRRNGG